MATASNVNPHPKAGRAAFVKATAWTFVALVALVGMSMWLIPAMLRQFTPNQVQGTVTPVGLRQHSAIRYISVPNTASSYDSQTLRLFQDPATCNSQTMTCVFADGRTIQLKPDELNQLIKNQTGQTMEYLIAQGTRVPRE